MAPARGAATVSVPLSLSAGRSGVGPPLALRYDSGGGNTAFGLGFEVTVPRITRKTSKGVPRYPDAAGGPGAAAPDVYLISDAEDLVPALVAQPDGSWLPDMVEETVDGVAYRIERYRPRVEMAFDRIERCVNLGTGDAYWRTLSRDNVASVFGRDPAARVADPADPSHVFEWLLEQVSDDRGNVTGYEYKAEDLSGVDTTALCEQHRLTGPAPAARYLKQVRYGNRTPGTLEPACFLIVFDYGEHDLAPDEVRPWTVRTDPFSSCCAGFEVRTWRLCRRVLVFHDIPEEFGSDGGPTPRLVRSTDLGYAADPLASALTSVTHTGYVWSGGAYQASSLPPVEFGYTASAPDTVVRQVEAPPLPDTGGAAGGGGTSAGPFWVDLDGEGLPGALSRTTGGWWYQRNLGGGRLDALEAVGANATPGLAAGRRLRLADITGDGRCAVVETGPELFGLCERDEEGSGWAPFRPFTAHPAVNFDDPALRQVDLTGDGLADLLTGTGTGLIWYPSLGREGYGQGEASVFGAEEEDGPPLGAVDPTGTTVLADMSGDGLADVVRIRNGEVCYWQNLGYGRFGPKVTMDRAPVFDTPDLFDPRRLRLADIEGAGPADIIYLGRDGAAYWRNQSGNGFGPRQELSALPPTDTLVGVSVTDLLGTGTPCLVWSSPLSAVVCYVDLAAGGKSRLLNMVRGNTGAETTVKYAASTSYYLADRLAGTPWVTKLPFPVPVVAAVQASEAITGANLATTYRYRHGRFDGVEREFRGFGMVEHTDAESFDGPDAPPGDLPPVRTRDWFSVGSYADVLTDCYVGDSLAVPLDGLDLDPAVSGDGPISGPADGPEYREALRASAGKPLRTEVYADDGTASAAIPYAVTEHRYHATRLQPAIAGRQHAVFYVYELESIGYHYERNPADPRIGHSLTLAVDQYGSVRSQAKVGYPRRVPAIPEQGQLTVQWDLTNVADTDTAQVRRLGVPVESQSYQAVSLPAPSGSGGRYRPAELAAALAAAVDLPFESVYTGATPPAGKVGRRLVADQRTRYWADDLSAPLPLGQIGIRALVWQSYSLALTPGLATTAYGSGFDASLLTSEGGYISEDGQWWAPTGVCGYDPSGFYLPVSQISPFGNTSTITYDAYHLLPVSAAASQVAPFSMLTTTVQNDYRVLSPVLVTDPNGNRRSVAYDGLGLVTAAWAMGKEGSSDGDTPALPGAVYTYDLDAWRGSGVPGWALAETREQHGNATSPWQRVRVHTDGLGRIAMTKVQAAPGQAWTLDSHGNAVLTDTSPNPRWVGSGRTVRNNKDLPIERYENYFSATSDYEEADALVKKGVTPILSYDPLGRLIRTDLPDGTYTKVEFDPWQSVSYDAGDTVLDSVWYTQRTGGGASVADQRAATLAAAYANTPSVRVLDALGRAVRARADDGPDGVFETVLVLDPLLDNTLKVTDPRGVVAATQIVDLLGRVMSSVSADAGARRDVLDCAGMPLRRYDAIGTVVRYAYDLLHRPIETWVTAPGSSTERLTDLAIYGEQHPQAVHLNLLGLVHRRYDQSGVNIARSADFKGNLLSTVRRLTPVAAAAAAPDWSPLHGAPLSALYGLTATLLDAEAFTTETSFDAMNRPVVSTLPDGSRISPVYDAGGLLASVQAALGTATTPTSFVTALEYDAKSQRQSISYGNGAVTSYDYDPETFRLIGITTKGPGATGPTLQDLAYTYDPVGNVVEVDDTAAQTTYFAGAVVAPGSRYTYDAVYRLRTATGREHSSLGVQPDSKEPTYEPLPHPNDAQALRTYTENYTYDQAGNLLTVAHLAGPTGTWTRRYQYAADSDRLLNHSLPSDPSTGPGSAVFAHDANGRMTTMAHLPGPLGWDHADRLVTVDLGGGGTAGYAYDAADQRARRIVGRTASLTEERIYLGSYELYRRYQSGVLVYERRTVHVMDGTGRIAMVETVTVDTADPGSDRTPALRYQLGDHLGSAMIELDDAGAPISYEEYHPYGSTALWLARGAAQVSTKRYRYTGKEKDDETGLSYYGSRYYASWLGRWTCADPGGGDGPNLYAYARNNPVTLIDPNGRDGQQKSAEQIASDQIRAALHVEPTDFVLSLGKGPLSMVVVRDAMIKAGVMNQDGSPTAPPPPPPPPPSHHPFYPHPQPQGEISKPTHAQLEHGHDYEIAQMQADFHKNHPTSYDLHMGEMADLGKAVDPSSMGVIKAPVALVYVLAGDDIATAQSKAAVVDAPVGVLATMVAPHGNVPDGTSEAAADDPHGTPVMALDERAVYMQQRAANKAAGVPLPTSDRAMNPLEMMQRTRPVNAANRAAADAFLADLRNNGTFSTAGGAAHDALGAAGPGQGVDFIDPATITEFKSHGGSAFGLFEMERSMRQADVQTLEVQRNLQQAAQESGRPQLVKIRLQRHLFVDPKTNQAVQVTK